MTKFLSRALQAPEPFFRQALTRLESANAHPNTDIRFSSEVSRASKDKLRELGLDPQDTTPEELYHALQERVKSDDAKLNRTLRTLAATHVSAEADVVAGMIHALKQLPDSKRCFAIKPSALRSVLRQVPPKKAMKRLGYRSLDSFIKHETPVSILAAARLSEDANWHKRLLNRYKKLSANDFESRGIQLVEMDAERWRGLADDTVNNKRHNLICLKELGALVFLPLPEHAPQGSTMASLSLALHELNEIRAASTFLKLCQVRPDFGDVAQQVAAGDEPHLESPLLDQVTPWRLIQHYYSGLTRRIREEVAEPHLQLEDIAWHPIEESLSAIEPRLDFWHNSSYLGLLHSDGPVSMNVVDAALGVCNRLSFERRLSNYFQRTLKHELMLRYLQPDTVERAITAQVQPQLAEEMVTV
ncbi:MAG TPA: hypothetical protein VHA05_03455 [Candidatus Saccharimonadales bacterium]|nr:hypothetical protein [Candidatus Saccharimonadales bacterium]